MLAPYRKILAYPGTLAFSSAGVLARLPMSMVTLSIILLVSSVYDQYTIAGATAAIYTISQSLCAPQISKLVDRYGQAKVMRPFLTVAMVGLSGLGVAAGTGAHPGWVFTFAALAGATVGSMGAMTRSRWNLIVATPGELHTAYSLESALDELVFVTGPVLAAFLATQFNPVLGLAVAILIAGGGGFWFLSQKATEPPAAGRDGAPSPGTVLANSGMLVLVSVFFCMGIIFGGSDVSSVAYTEVLGVPQLSGVVLASLAFGSLLSGVLYGTRTFVIPTWKQFVIGASLLGVGASLFVIITSLPLLIALMFITGFAIAPTIISGNSLVQQFVPAHRLTEGLAWTGTSIGLGFAAGSSIAGWVIDNHSAHGGYLTVTGAALTGTILALSCARVLRRKALAPPATDATG